KKKSAGRLRKLLLWLFLLVLLGTALVSAAGFYVHRWLHSPMNLPAQGYTYELQSGRALAHLVQDLERLDFLQHSRWLILYARATRAAQVRAGEYLLTPELTPLSLLEKLKRGDVVVHQVTLVEGWTYRQALSQLHRQEALSATLSEQSPEQQLALLDLPITHPEGWFFPDTYTYIRGTTDVDLLRRA